MKLDLRQLLLGDPNRLRYVVRFGNCHKIHHESVAEHSYYTVLYAWLIAEWCNQNKNPTAVNINVRHVMMKAVIHDLEEARSGDFPRPFKYSDPEVKKALDIAGGVAFDQAFGPIVKNSKPQLQWVRKLWENAKDETPEGCVVALADYLSVLSYLWLEIQGSNVTMRMHIVDMEAYHRIFEGPQFKFLKPLIEEAGVLLAEAMGNLKRKEGSL